MQLDLQQARRQAKELLARAHAGDDDALALLRADRAPCLADAQHAVATVLGFASWPALVAHVAARTSAEYARGRPVRINVRERPPRVDIDDGGGAVAAAGAPPGWRRVAQAAVEPLGWNISRSGVVFMRSVVGRDIDALVDSTVAASLAVYDALICM